MSEHAQQGRSGTALTRMMTGYHVGAVLTALLALWPIPSFGWQAMFVVGGGAGLLTVPVMWAKLPGSRTYAQTDRVNAVRPTEVVRGRLLWGQPRPVGGLVHGAAAVVYGLNTWLPTIMGEAGYSLEAGLGLLLTLNIGAVIGLMLAGRISDARGNKPTVVLWFGVAAVMLALLSIKMQTSVLVYGAVLAVGVLVFNAQVLVYAFVSHLCSACAGVRYQQSHKDEKRRLTLEDVEDVFAGQAPFQAPSRRSARPGVQMS
jgi:AAHS family benzoate transporter-like MFS transporter